MSRIAISLSLVLAVAGADFIAERDADACGVKLAIKSGRRPKAKREPEKTGNRPVVGAREARTPVAVGPIDTRHPISSKPRATPIDGAAGAEPAPAPATRVATPTPAPKPVDKPAVAAVKPVADKPAVAVVEKPVTVKKPVVEKPVVKPVEKPVVDKPVVAVATQTKTPTEVTPAPATVAELEPETFFTLGGAYLTPNATNSLKKTARWMKANASVGIVIEGHADTTGNPDFNLELGTRRANAARAFLVSQGIDESRIETKSLGDTNPKYPGTDARNRRVFIVPR